MTKEQERTLATYAVIKAREVFPAFLKLLYTPGHNPYLLGSVHLYLAGIIQGMVDGTQSLLQAISLPPQHGKSQLVSVRAVAWVLGAFPGVSVGLTGFSHDLLVGFVADIRTVMRESLYNDVFPGVEPVFGFERQDELRLSNGSSLAAKTTGKYFTGRRVDWLVVDDAHAGRKEAESNTERENIKRWFFADCISRLAPGAKTFLVGTRWHPSDLIGYVTSEEYTHALKDAGREDLVFNVINFSAIAEEGETDPLGREPGEALFPEARDVKFLEGVKAVIPKYEWDSQYRGKPRASASGQVDITRIVKVDLSEVPTDIPWVRGWDLALTEKQTSDYSAGALCAYDKRTELFYLIDMVMHRLTWTKMKQRVIDVAMQDKEKHNCLRMGLEAVSGFEIGLQELRQSLAGEVTIEKRNPPKGGKLMRAQAWLNLIEAGRFRIVRASWNKDVLDNIDAFPDVEHDDICDGISVANECVCSGKKLLLA